MDLKAGDIVIVSKVITDNDRKYMGRAGIIKSIGEPIALNDTEKFVSIKGIPDRMLTSQLTLLSNVSELEKIIYGL